MTTPLACHVTQATLRGQLKALEQLLKGKEAELEGLMHTIALKDRTIQELQQELKRLRAERAAAEVRVRELEDEKARLESELLELKSQGRIHHLSMGDLQDRLTRAYANRDELVIKLKLAEEALKDKVSRTWICGGCGQLMWVWSASAGLCVL